MLEKKIKVNKEARPDSGISYIDEKVVVESRDGKRGVLAIFLETGTSNSGRPVTRILLSQDDFRQLEFELDEDTDLEFDEEIGVGEFTSRGKRYRIRALQDFDNPARRPLRSKEDEKD
jgi:hypothetical protein